MLIGDVWITTPMVRELCNLTGVHRTTVQRWLTKRKLPRPIYLLLDLMLNGSIVRIHSAWSGFTIDANTGDLVTPLGWPIRPGEILALQLRYQQIAALQCEVRELRTQGGLCSDSETEPGHETSVNSGRYPETRR